MQYSAEQSPKFKRVSLNETLEFPFWRLNICVDFGLRYSKNMENMKKLNKVIVHNKNINIHKTPYPIRETRVLSYGLRNVFYSGL